MVTVKYIRTNQAKKNQASSGLRLEFTSLPVILFLSVVLLFSCSCTLQSDFDSLFTVESSAAGSPAGGKPNEARAVEVLPSSEMPNAARNLKAMPIDKAESSLKQENIEINGVSSDPRPWQLPDMGNLPYGVVHSTEIIGVFPVEEGSYISVDKGGVILYWKPESAGGMSSKKLLQLPYHADKAAYSFALGRLAISSVNEIHIYFLRSLSKEYTLGKLKTRLTAMEFHPDGVSILLGGADGMVYRWKFEAEAKAKTATDKELSLERYVGHSTVVSAVAFHPDGRFFFSGDWRGHLSAWLLSDRDIFGGRYDQNLFAGHMFTEKAVRTGDDRGGDIQPIEQIRVTKDGQNVFLAMQGGTVEWWQVRGFKKVAGIHAHKGLIYDMAVSDDGKSLVTAGRDGAVRIFKPMNSDSADVPESLTLEKEFQLPGARRVAFAGEKVIVGYSDGKVEPVS